MPIEPLDDYPIGRERDTLTVPAEPRNGKWRVWSVIAVVLIIAAALLAFFVTRPSSGPGAAATDPAASGAKDSQARKPLGPEVPPRELPPLDLTDPLVRELIGALSSRPELATWLATDDLIRGFAASIDAIANGVTPAPHLRSLAPARPFAAQPRGEAFVIDQQSYRRYDGVADTIETLDAEGLARAYATLRPRLQEAYRELGYPDANFDVAVERAIGRLLETPMLPPEIQVQPAPVLYQFVDPRIERLSAAQKHLLRMGPRNQRLIQDKLRDIAAALGIAAS